MKTKTILTLLVMVIGINLLRAETITIDMIKYSLDENTHTATVVDVVKDRGWGDNSSITEANIRSSVTYKGTSYRVTKINNYAFLECNRLQTVSIPNSIQTIGKGAFRRCTALTTVTISAKEIGDEAFQDCTNLQYITLNEGVTKIGENAFWGKFTSITIPNSVTVIGSGAFKAPQLQSVKFGTGIRRIESSTFAGTSLREVVIPQNVTYIGESAFGDCKKLTKVTIHNKVKDIKGGAFAGCVNLQTFELASDNPYYTLVDGVLFNKDKTILVQYSSGKKNTSYTIPSSVIKIAPYAFNNIPSLRSVQISNSVTEIGNGCFGDCKNLETLRIGNNVKKIGDYVCNFCKSLSDFIIPNSVEEIGGHAFEYCDELMEIVIPGSVQYVGSHAFADCRSLTIKVPSHTRCYRDAFLRCEKWETYDTTNPAAERKKAQDEEKRKKVQAEKDKQRQIQYEKERKEREQKAQREAEARIRKAEQERIEKERQVAYNKWHKLYMDSIKAGYVRGQECVDLGLSVAWATCNIGAKKPQNKGKEMYAKDINKNMNVQKGWRLPARWELGELFDKCTIEPVGGFLHYKYIKLVSKINGNYIIIPNAFGVVSEGVCIRLWASDGGSYVWKQRDYGRQGYKQIFESEYGVGDNACGYLRCVIEK